jgi:hypothetical protein
VGQYLHDTLLVPNDQKQVDALSSLLLRFSKEYSIRKVQESKEGFKLNGTDQLLVYADEVTSAVLLMLCGVDC